LLLVSTAFDKIRGLYIDFVKPIAYLGVPTGSARLGSVRGYLSA
jgi:hypothetical protein